ncbi:MAG: hypothetical protein QM791_04835 [Ferruginibacter sp.]
MQYLLLLSSFFLFSCLYGQDRNINPLFANKKNSTDTFTNNIIWKGTADHVKINTIATYGAPVLWFSPDEPSLGSYLKNGISIPEPFPFEKPSAKPVVYYKVLNVVTNDKETEKAAFINNPQDKGASEINLAVVKVFYLDYYFYYSSEVGAGSHPHDIESAVMKIVVNYDDSLQQYILRVAEIIGRAHGLYWYNNVHTTEYHTKFPITILIEEGKHASCPDANGDGIYTPSFDVNKRTNDAWGIRDIIRSGILYSGGFENWMCKSRDPVTIVSPPLPGDSPLYETFINDKRKLKEKVAYELRPFPETGYTTHDRHLSELMKGKEPVNWPEIKHSSAEPKYIHKIEEDQEKKTFSAAFRKDAGGNYALYTPLLLFKNVSAPMTGGWLVNKFYFGRGDLIEEKRPDNSTYRSVNNTTFGHMIMHIRSASRWLDSYFGAGYEINDYDLRRDKYDYRFDFTAEYGFKIRANMKIFKKVKFIGVRLGYQITGFNPIKRSGLIFEIGAGLW